MKMKKRKKKKKKKQYTMEKVSSIAQVPTTLASNR